MNEDRSYATYRQAARVVVWVVGIILALAVGAPWLLYDAPPSPEAAVVTKLWRATAPTAVAPRPAPTIAPTR